VNSLVLNQLLILPCARTRNKKINRLKKSKVLLICKEKRQKSLERGKSKKLKNLS
jgi:hypothetical protein